MQQNDSLADGYSPLSTRWVVSAVINSVIIFFGTVYFLDSPDGQARDLDLWMQSTIVYTSLHVVVHVKLMVAQSSWTVANLLVNMISISMWFLFWPLYTQNRTISFGFNPALYCSFHSECSAVSTATTAAFVLALAPLLGNLHIPFDRHG